MKNNKNNNIENNNDNKNIRGRRPLIGSLSEETFFTLAHTLYSFPEYMKYLLHKKKFKFILFG